MRTITVVAEFNEQFVEWLVQRMGVAGMSRKELAHATGMSEGAVKRWFHGATPQRDTVNLIAAALGADILEAQRAAGHLRRRDAADSVPVVVDGPVAPLSPAEIVALRGFLASYDPETSVQYRRMAALMLDMAPSAWRRLRALAEALDT